MHPLRLTFTALLLLPACSTEDTGSLPTDASTTTGTTSTGTATETASSGTTDASTGATTGSTNPTSGTTADPTTGGGPVGPECQQDSDCVLVNNCCECDPKPVTEVVAECEETCLQSTCDALQIGNIDVACRSGRCEFANVPCGDGPVGCNEEPPTCPEGKTLAVVNDCWACVEPRYCSGASCSPGGCGDDDWFCMTGQSGSSACAPVPLECPGSPNCDCLSPYLDEFCGGACGEGTDGPFCADGG